MSFVKLVFGAVLITLSLFSTSTYAADWGPCQTDSGIPHDYWFDITHTIMVPTENKSGKIVSIPFDLGNTYSAYCQCPDPIPQTGVVTRFKGESTLLDSTPQSNYYKLNNNISVLTKIYIFRRGNYIVPFTDVDNVTPGLECTMGSSTGWTTGSKGDVLIKITKPFTGELDIPKTQIAALYGSKKASSYGSIPMATVSISGKITVTQGCELAAGTVLDIPFGEYQAHDFKGRAGQPPQNVRKVQKELSFDCNNISDGVKIYLSIDATPNNAYPSAIDLGNADVGAVIEDDKGNILKPNDSNSLLEMNPGSLYEDVKRKATTTITAYPVSTTGKLPAAGDYSGIATMHVELE